MTIIRCPYCKELSSIDPVSISNGQTPKITCSHCKKRFVHSPSLVFATPDSPNNNDQPQPENTINPEVLGWLVVHDEKTKSQTFSLKLGNQLVGRKSTSRPCDIMIETEDKYMSRNHFFIEIKLNKNNQYEYLLYNNEPTNPTYLDLEKLDDFTIFKLKDGNTIQAGETKIGFKSIATVATKTEATEEIRKTSYTTTVFINKK